MSLFANSIIALISRSVLLTISIPGNGSHFLLFNVPSKFLLDAGHYKFKFLSAEFCCIPLKTVELFFWQVVKLGIIFDFLTFCFKALLR